MTHPPTDITPETQPSRAGDSPQAEPSAEQTLAALLGDLGELRDYLTQRGRHTYDLAQKFLDSAKRSQATRAYDERQATMLEYQHSILSDMNFSLWWVFPTAPTAKTVPAALASIA